MDEALVSGEAGQAPTLPLSGGLRQDEALDSSHGGYALPEQFGRYRLDELIGRGGMGEIFRAYDTVKERIVAVKRLPPSLAKDPAFSARFRRESKIAGLLREPHVIPIHDYGEIEGQLFIEMRLVDGVDLAAQLAADGPFAPDRAVNIITQIAHALDAAHAEGLVHRDVKPSNALISGSRPGDDYIYLVDFGIAHSAGGTTLTESGATVGTLHYMAPERFLQGGDGDLRVDVYALACLLFELLTGERPFSGEGLPRQMYAHLNLPPPKPSERRTGVPRSFDQVISKGMAKEPGKRYASAGALATAARAALNTGPSRRPEAPPASPLHDTTKRHLAYRQRSAQSIRRPAVSDPTQGNDARGNVGDEQHQRVTARRKAVTLGIATTVAAIFLLVLVPAFAVQVFTVQSEGMESTLHGGRSTNNDRILVDKIAYQLSDPQPGDIVVFRGPDSWTSPELQEQDYISRVIAVSGQTVQCCDALNRVLVDGQPLTEHYLYHVPGAAPMLQQAFGPYVVPRGYLWMMGDNRNNSRDSRSTGHGPVPVDNVVGKALSIVLPVVRWAATDVQVFNPQRPRGLSSNTLVTSGGLAYLLIAGATVATGGAYCFAQQTRGRWMAWTIASALALTAFIAILALASGSADAAEGINLAVDR
ncbi:MAG: signal peptidase I [Dehalococcoidia bacterium]